MTRQLRRSTPPRQSSGDHRDGERRDLVHRKLTAERDVRATNGRRSPPYARDMRLPSVLRLPPRSLVLEAATAVFSGLSVRAVSLTSDDIQVPPGVVFTGSVLLAVAVFLLRRTAPLVPFLGAAVLG